MIQKLTAYLQARQRDSIVRISQARLQQNRLKHGPHKNDKIQVH